jgi:hypothetical protein
VRRRENVCKNNDGVMRNRNRIDVKYVIFQKLVKVFGLEKTERIFRMFEWRKS